MSSAAAATTNPTKALLQARLSELELQVQQFSAADVTRAFGALDCSKSGSVGADELRSMFLVMGQPIPAAEAAAMVRFACTGAVQNRVTEADFKRVFAAMPAEAEDAKAVPSAGVTAATPVGAKPALKVQPPPGPPTGSKVKAVAAPAPPQQAKPRGPPPPGSKITVSSTPGTPAEAAPSAGAMAAVKAVTTMWSAISRTNIRRQKQSAIVDFCASQGIAMTKLHHALIRAQKLPVDANVVEGTCAALLITDRVAAQEVLERVTEYTSSVKAMLVAMYCALPGDRTDKVRFAVSALGDARFPERVTQDMLLQMMCAAHLLPEVSVERKVQLILDQAAAEGAITLDQLIACADKFPALVIPPSPGDEPAEEPSAK